MLFEEFIDKKLKEKRLLFSEIRVLNRKKGSVREGIKKHSLWVDNVISRYFSLFGLKDDMCVVALGGYGRSQLNIYSDIDVMILSNNSVDDELVRGLYDTFYSLGYECFVSVRSLDECVSLSKQDDTIKTSIYDSRFLCGNKALYKQYKELLKREIIAKEKNKFIEKKIEYMKNRYAIYGNTVFVLEPNVKEGVGSLRDYHTLIWIGKTLFLAENLLSMKKQGIMNQEDYSQLRNSLYFLWQLRNALHFVTSKKTDILHLDLRDKVAYEMGFEPSKRFEPQERLMRKYYYHARNVERIVQKYLNLFLGTKQSILHDKTQISEDIMILDDKIYHRKVDLGIFDALIIFHYSAMYNSCISIETADRMKKAIGRDIRKHKKDRIVAYMFRNILSLNKPVIKTLRIMHEMGFLDKFIPEFGNICCLSEYSLYHKYTVDEHSMQALEHLDALYDFDIPKTFITRLSYIWKNLKPHDRYLLRLAVLLHDVGKVKKEKHEIVGSELAKDVARRLGLGKELEDKLVFLIKNHLLISRTISTRDIEDPKTLKDFVSIVDNRDKLNLLSLLSYVDMKAVNDNVWNSWRESLIEALYLKTVYYFEDKNYDEYLKINAKESKRRIKAVLGKEYEEIVEEFPDNIFNDIDNENMAKYIRNIHDTTRSVFIYKTGKDVDKLLVYYKNEFGLFHKISGVLACFGINIISAKSYNLKNGMIVDLFDVNIPKDETVDAKSVEKMLNDIESGKVDLNQCVISRKNTFLSRIEKAKLEISLSQINVIVDNDLSDMYTVVRVYTPDRIGLVYDITKVFLKFKLHIGMFILDTKGAIAVDTFYVVDERYKKIYLDKLVNLIKSSLYEVLSFEE